MAAGRVSYEFFVRDPQSFAIAGELDPRVVSGQWTRHQFDPGSFQLVLPREYRRRRNGTVVRTADLVQDEVLIEVRRDRGDGQGSSREFICWVLKRQMDADGIRWTVGGPDLRWWLHRRTVGAEAAVGKADKAETVLKAYVDENLGSSAVAARRCTSELSEGMTFSIEADAARGGDVAYQAQRLGLDRVTADVCRQGDILHEIALVDTGLEYQVIEPTDATVDAGNIPFAVGFDNVEGLGYRSDLTNLQNLITVCGDGTGDTRRVREVDQVATSPSRFRCEGVMTAAACDTDDLLDAVGGAECSRQAQAAIAADVVPLTVSQNARYREDWDVGFDVTVAIPDAGVSSIDRRVASATVSLTEARGERISMSLGTERPMSVMRRLDAELGRLRAAVSV